MSTRFSSRLSPARYCASEPCALRVTGELVPENVNVAEHVDFAGLRRLELFGRKQTA